MRLAQMSELIRSESFQSGPRSITTTFLPARVSTAANTAPAAPAPTMTASTFSNVAMSPAPRRLDVRHIGRSDPPEALDCSVDDVDRVVAQRQIDAGLGGALPSLELALPQRIDEIALLGRIEGRKRAPVLALARALDAGERGAIEVDVGRSRFGHPDGEQRLLGRDRELAVDEMRDAVLPCPDRERLADRFERLRFLELEHAHGRALGARLPWSEQNLGAADRKGECAERRALDEFSPRNLIHGVPPSLPYASPAPVGRSLSRQ